MKCNDCGREIKRYFTFSEKAEVYYCIDCCHNHVDDDLVYIKIKNKQLIRLNVGVSGAGIGNQFQKHYTNEEWILRHERCEHLQDFNNLKYPMFYCMDGKLRCSECLFDEDIDRADPLMKNEFVNENKNNILRQLPFTYEPHNLEFSFECDENGVEGKEINGKVIIKNNKKFPIKDIKLIIESFSAPPWDGNKPYGIHCENNYSKLIIFKEFKIDLIESNDFIEISTMLKIPKADEIKENQFLNNIYRDSLEQQNKGTVNSNKLLNPLKIPNELMVFAKFNYKSYSEYEYKSTIETKLVNIK